MAEKPTYEELEKRVHELEKAKAELNQVEQPLLVSEQNAKQYLDIAGVIILALDSSGGIILINKYGLKVLGYRRKELLGKNWFRTCLPDRTQKKVTDVYRQLMRGEIKLVEYYENQIKRKDGEKRTISWHNAVLRNSSDEITGTLSSGEDITERKLAKEALLESEEKYRGIFENAVEGFFQSTPEGRFISVNPSFAKMLGYASPEDLISSISDIAKQYYINPEDRRRYMQLLKNDGSVEHFEFEARCKDGSQIWVSNSTRAIYNPNGKIIRFEGNVNNITERKHAVEELQKSEIQHKALIKNIPGMVYRAYSDWSAEIFSGSEMISGYTTVELKSKEKNWLSIVHPDDMETVYKVGSEFITKSKELVQTYRIITKSGNIRWVEDRKTSLVSKKGEFIGIDGIVFDITDRKQAEEALRSSEEKYRNIFENAVEGFFQSTPEGRFITVNPAFAKMFGYASQEDLISFISDIGEQYYVNPEDRRLYMQLLEKNGSVKHFEYQALCKDGSQIWVSDSTRAIYDPTGKVTRYEGNVNNITGRKQAEEALKDSETKYRSMMEAMKDPIYICSPDYRVEYMNPAMIKRTGRDATGEHCFNALHDFNDKCPWCIHHIIQQSEFCETDIVSPKDNRAYHVSHSPIVHEDGSISKMTIYRDTTDFKKMETQLRQAQKMEAIGTLAGGIAHDFNNILFPMFGYLEMILEDMPQDNPQRRLVQEVFSGAKRARDLVKQILAFSRQKDHDMKPVKVHPIVKEALDLIKSSLPSTIKTTRNIQQDCGLIFADSTQIHQIVMNLCTNAYHAMEETGGKLTVHLKEVELTAEDLKDTAMVPGKHVCLTVADTGPGMEQSIIDRIFDPYFTTKEKGKGTGLGLAVVDGIIKSHGGRISISSEPEKGTEFKVYLPVIKPQERAKSIDNDLPIQKGNEYILLVDDQKLIVDMERKMLERLGYHVTTRTSSPDALQAFRAQPDKFDVVITDMTMPNMTGGKLTEEMIKIRSDIPVILCTGFSEMMSKEKAAALGIKGFLMKPVVLKDLSRTIREVLDDE